MSTIFIERTVNLNDPIIPDTLTGVLNCGEADSHEFTISATLDNEPFALSGVVTANFIRSDGITVPLTGSISDGAAVVVLSNLCYNVPGRFAFTVFITFEGVTTAIYGCTGTVRQTDSGSIVDPGEIIPSVSGLITAIENAIAEIPADYSQLLATQAPTFSPSTAYAAGSYVWYDGTLYRFTAAHAAGSWTGSDAKAVTIGGELADLKSTIYNTLQGIYQNIRYNGTSDDWENANCVTNTVSQPTGTVIRSESTTRLTSKYIFPVIKGNEIKIKTPNGYRHRILFTVSKIGEIPTSGNITVVYFANTYNDISTWHTEAERVLIVPDCVGFIVVLSKTNDSTISPSDLPEDFFIETKSITNNTLEEASALFTNDEDIERNIGYYKRENIIDGSSWERGNRTPGSITNISSSTTRCYLPLIPIDPTKGKLRLELPSNMKGRMTFGTSANSYIDTTSDRSWTTGTFDFTVPTNAAKVGISVAFADDSTIITSDCNIVKAYQYIGNIPDDGQSAYKLKKISILGDSISTFAGNDAQSAGDGHSIADGTYTYAGNHCRYPNSYLSNVGDTYWKKLIDSLGMVLGVNDSWAGSRVSWNGSEGSDYGEDIYIASPTRIGHLDDNGTPDIILVNAGTNDIGLNVTIGTFNTENPVSYTDAQIAALPVATFADAYRAMLIRLQKKYPRARVVVMLPNYTTSYYNPTIADQYLEIIKEACDYFGVPWIDMRTTGITMYNTGTYTGDGIHPNVAGMNLLYKKLEKFFVYSL